MKSVKPSPKRRTKTVDPSISKEAELLKARKRIRELEKELDNRTEELDILKKAQRFFAKKISKI